LNYNVLVNQMLTNDGGFARFTQYFIGQYPSASGHLWAKFGRLHSRVSTNMHLDSYHRSAKKERRVQRFFNVVKNKFLGRLSNKRVDVVVKVLVLEVAPYYERLQNENVMLMQPYTNRMPFKAVYGRFTVTQTT